MTIRLTAASLLAAFAVALLLLLPAPALAQGAQVRVTFPEAQPALQPWSGTWQAIARVVLQVKPRDDADELDLIGIAVAEDATAFQYVFDVAFGLDTNGDGQWEPGVDGLHPGIPPAGPPGTSYHPAAPGVLVTMDTTSATWLFDVPQMIHLEAAAPQEWFLLFAVHPDAPADLSFKPYFPEVPGPYGGWTAATADFDVVDATLALPGSQTGDGVIDFDSWYIDLHEGVRGDHATGEITPLPDDPDVLDDWTERVYMRRYLIDGIEVTPTTLPTGRTVLAGERVTMADMTLTGHDPDGGTHTPTAVVLESASGIAAHIGALELVYDMDGDGLAGPADTWFGEEAGFHAVGEQRMMTASGLPALAHGESMRLLVLATFADVRVNMRYALRAVRVETIDSAVAGLPRTFPGVIGLIDRVPQLLVAIADEGARDVPTGERVVLARLVVDALDTPATLRMLRVRAVGSLPADTDVALVEVIADTHADGRIGESDTVLAAARYSGGEARLDLASPPTIPLGGRVQLLLAVTFAAGARPGATHGVELVALASDESVPVVLPADAGSPVTIGDGSDDPEFDPLPLGPFTVAGGAGCTAGPGCAGCVWLMLLAATLGMRRLRRTD